MQFIFSTLYFLISLFIDFFVFILLLRLLFQKLGAPWHNPISQFVIRFTEPLLKPLRRFIPGYRGFDLSILFLAFLAEFLEAILLGLLHYRTLFSLPGLSIIAFGHLGFSFSNVYFYAIILSALMSWFPLLQNNPLGQITQLISLPVLTILRRVIPRISGMDFSPLFALVALYLANRLILAPLIAFGIRLGLK